MLIFGLILTYLYAANTGDAYGGNVLSEEATKLSAFMFGAPLKIIGISAGAYGIFSAFKSQSVQPLLLFGLMGAACVIIPKFIEGIFTALVP